MIASPIGRALVAALVVGAVALAIYGLGYRDKGRVVQDQNQKARETADETEMDLDACLDAGRVWDFAASRCGGRL